MRYSQVLCVCFLVVGPSQPCWGQFIRVPVRVPVVRPPVVRPPVVHPVPVHVHDRSRQNKPNQENQAAAAEWSWEEILAWTLGGLAVVIGAAGVWHLVRDWRRKSIPRALIRITAMPPGEPPDWVRSAWVGLELPLMIGQVCPEGGVAEQAVSRREVNVPDGYAVEGRTAIAILETASADAGKWWRENAPDVLAPGYQMVFPKQVCERLDDLGQQNR